MNTKKEMLDRAKKIVTLHQEICNTVEGNDPSLIAPALLETMIDVFHMMSDEATNENRVEEYNNILDDIIETLTRCKLQGN